MSETLLRQGQTHDIFSLLIVLIFSLFLIIKHIKNEFKKEISVSNESKSSDKYLSQPHRYLLKSLEFHKKRATFLMSQKKRRRIK
jgi:hypothetical protein